MTCWAVIPVRAPGDGKTRLSGVLDAAERIKLVHAMLERVVGAAAQARRVSRVLLLGPSRHGLPESLALLSEPGGGLNVAVQGALAELGRAGIERALFVAADLPQASTEDLELLSMAPARTVAIAPDRHGTGTNAISLPLPEARGFVFAFGPGSFARHRSEAERLGLRVAIVDSPRLRKDVDEPADLPDAAELLR